MHLVMSLVLLSEAYLYLERDASAAFAAKSRASVGKTGEAETAEPTQGKTTLATLSAADSVWQ